MDSLPRQTEQERDFWAEEYECATMFLDYKKVEKEIDGVELSLVGRIRLYAGTFDFNEKGNG